MKNTFKILDCGEILNLKYTEYQMVPNYVIEFERQMTICRQVVNAICFGNNDYIKATTREEVEEMNSLYRKWSKNDLVSMNYFHSEGSIPKSDYKLIARLMGHKPFQNAVMINISPNWKGKFDLKGVKGKMLTKMFSNVIQEYLESCDRYTQWKFCLECGGEGNFLHAHIVAEINPKMEKSVITHINKGNHKIEIMKKWEKTISKRYPTYPSGIVKGSEGLLKGKFSIQRILIRNEEMLKDKLDYLIEGNKPDGHQNLYDLQLIKGDYIYC